MVKALMLFGEHIHAQTETHRSNAMSLHYDFKVIDHCSMCGNLEGFAILGKRLNAAQGKKPTSKIGITTTIVRCKNCGLVFSNPQPIPQNLLDHYGITPDSYWQNDYFQIEENCFQREIKIARQLLGERTDANIVALDIGAGIGKAMSAMHRAGFEVYGIEPSASFYEYAIKKTGICPDQLRLMPVETASFPEEFFDFITFGAVLEHLYDPSFAIVRALRWLKPGGIMQVEVPSSQWLVNKIANVYYRLIGTDYVANLSPMHSPFHLYEFSLDSFRKHGQSHNYELAFCEHFVCQTYMPKILDRFLYKVMDVTKTGMQLGVWLRKK